MKKFLLTMAAVAMGLGAFATQVTFDFTADSYGLPAYDADLGNNSPYVPMPSTVTQGDVSITFDGTTDGTSTGWRVWSDGIREYNKRDPKFTVTVKGTNVTGVEWTAKSAATFALEGTDINITSWGGNAASVTFVGTASSNAAVETITVYYDETFTPEPEPGTPENVIYSESFKDSLGDFEIVNVDMDDALTYIWSFAEGYGAKASAYVSSTNHEAEGWLVSPEINLNGYTEAALSFEHAINYLNGNTVLDFCNVYVGEGLIPNTSSWTKLSELVKYPAGTNWTFVNSGEISLNAYLGKSIKIGFLYTSSDSVAPTWEIKNFTVTGTKADGVAKVGFDVNGAEVIYNLQGVRVANPVKGQIYIVNGKKVVY